MHVMSTSTLFMHYNYNCDSACPADWQPVTASPVNPEQKIEESKTAVQLSFRV